MWKNSNSLQQIWNQFKKNKPAIFGLIVICIFVIMAVFADVIVDYDYAVMQDRTARLLFPCLEHIFGTDHLGRDVFARIVHGSRTSLTLGVVSTVISLIIGGILGIIAGYFGKWIDSLIMRVMDTLMCIPGILLSLCIIAVLGANTVNLLIAVTISSVPGFTRMLRATVITMTSQEYIDAAKAAGGSHRKIICTHILPNAIGMIIVQATMSISGMIVFASGLSFLGLGVQPPRPEWGVMLSDAKKYMRNYPYLLIFPGISIALSALSLNLLGDGLRDALDPRSTLR